MKTMIRILWLLALYTSAAFAQNIGETGGPYGGQVGTIPRYPQQPANMFLAAPCGVDGVPLMRNLCDSDLTGIFGSSLTATALSGAATLNSMSGIVTSESLTTAQNLDYTLTLTDSAILATDRVMASIANGNNSTGSPVLRTVAVSAGQVVFVIRNMNATAVAFNGTLKVSFVAFH